GDVVAAEHLRLERTQEVTNERLAWIHLERRAPVDFPLPGDEPEPVVGAEKDAADAVAAPPLAAETELQIASVVVTDRDRSRVVSIRDADPARELEEDLEPGGTRLPRADDRRIE